MTKSLEDHLKNIPSDMIFEIKQYFYSCKKCIQTIKEEEITEKCDVCNSVWCCSSENTSKKYFEVTISICDTCYAKIRPNYSNNIHQRRQNIVTYIPLSS